jgi:quinoprotein glucose dehydrogenase
MVVHRRDMVPVLGAALLWTFAFAHAGAEQTPPVPASPDASVRSTSTGVYTDAQATRGEALYADTCARCHGKSLEGDPAQNAASLAGADYLKARTGQDLGKMFRYIIERMPDDDPGTLTAANTADLIAYILKFNKFPAGKDELPTEIGRLKLIVIGTSGHPVIGPSGLQLFR